MPIDTKQPRVRVAAIIIENNSVLMVRHEKAGASYWMLPGGGVDYGEALADALRRELREELCIEAAIGPLLFANDSVAPTGERHIINLHFRAHITSGTPRLGEDERIVEVAFQPVSSLEHLVMRPAYAPQLRAMLEQEQLEGPSYLGNIWIDG